MGVRSGFRAKKTVRETIHDVDVAPQGRSVMSVPRPGFKLVAVRAKGGSFQINILQLLQCTVGDRVGSAVSVFVCLHWRQLPP
jgi:hypothetical protein